MGQVTLPVLNRKGISAIWENHWETTLDYENSLSEDLFLKKFFKIFLRNWISTGIDFQRRMYFRDKNLSLKSKRVHSYIDVEKYYLLDEVSTFELPSKLFKKFPFYNSRIYLIKYNNWIIIYAFVYVPDTWRNRFKILKKKQYNYNTLINLHNLNISKSVLKKKFSLIFKNKKYFLWIK